MPIDLEKAVGAELAGGTAVWDEDDIILYHLGDRRRRAAHRPG